MYTTFGLAGEAGPNRLQNNHAWLHDLPEDDNAVDEALWFEKRPGEGQGVLKSGLGPPPNPFEVEVEISASDALEASASIFSKTSMIIV